MATYYPHRTLPLGVAVLAILIGIFGAILVIVGLALIVIAGLVGLATSFTFFGLVGLVGGIVILIFGAILLAVARGLWDQQLWALVLCLIIVGLFLFSDVFTSNYGLGFIIDLVLVVYLVLVSNHFR